MKNNIKRYIHLLLVLIVFSFTSCSKDLNLVPQAQLSDASFWKTGSDFEKAANNLYADLSNHQSGWIDGETDLADADGPQLLINVVPQSDDNWVNSYKSIRRASKIIENYELASEIQQETARYAGEAHFFRARIYFNLLKRYGEVPIISSVLDLDSEELLAPRNTREEVLAFIINELDWAISNLPVESQIPEGEKGRVSRGAAHALKCRVGLFEGTWNKYHGIGDIDFYLNIAISEAEAIISSAEYDIYKVGPVPYYDLFLEKGTKGVETILARQYALNVSTHNTTRWLETANNNPTKFLADSYLCTDGLPIEMSPLFQGYDLKVSEFENRDPRMQQTIWLPFTEISFHNAPKIFNPLIGSGNGPSSTGYNARKYFSLDADCHNQQCHYDFLEFRYGEVLLNLAEALFERDGSISDSDLDRTINKLRDRVGMIGLTNQFIATNGLDMLSEIRRERTIELAYEGFRLDDIKRWKLGPELLAVDFKGVKYTGTEQETIPPNDIYASGGLNLDANGFVIADPGSNRPWSERDYLDPLPQDQLQLNSSLNQNPGW
ncbi:RagB/SusD family nutrient uptake outer membrane protein [Arenibacter sp. ARW7G5Y1]|uniref:RagB/SusD family nutrient uptake outer membrane protein n=1 Tax=Arenibacter sp. ARW7G5Y1 TaxID=2135619 RepID=UPI000D751CA8|nr:RagB/SusD family nutrient uptake outer membrane protein [Arenibacter sp. ARW7G5Y1]PXX22860.1 putative outer membrane starch-binding protein [Arenibacter sp. ARW7G5Y1]